MANQHPSNHSDQWIRYLFYIIGACTEFSPCHAESILENKIKYIL